MPNEPQLTAQHMVGLVITGLTVLFLISRKNWKPSTDALGTARWATEAECRRAKSDLVLGRSARSGRLIFVPKESVHLSVFAFTGAGKAVSLLVPWLLLYKRGSCVVLDPKGELYTLTGHARRCMGQTVVRLDPFGMCGPGADTWNPLDLIGDGPDCVDFARPLAEAMVVRPPEGDRDPHWGDQSANVLTGLVSLILTVCEGRERSLGAMRDLLTTPGAFENCANQLLAMGGVYARLGGVMKSLEDKEKAGVLSTVHRHTTWLDSSAMIQATRASTFDMRELLGGTVTVYLVLPPAQLESHARWLRCVIAALIRLIGTEGMKPGNRVLDAARRGGHGAWPHARDRARLDAAAVVRPEDVLLLPVRGLTEGDVSREGGGAARQHRADLLRRHVARKRRPRVENARPVHAARRESHRERVSVLAAGQPGPAGC